MVRLITLAAMLALAQAYAPTKILMADNQGMNSRRAFVSQGVAFTLGTASASFLTGNTIVEPANAVGPVKIKIINPTYSAAPCPPSKPIPVSLTRRCLAFQGATRDTYVSNIHHFRIYLVGGESHEGNERPLCQRKSRIGGASTKGACPFAEIMLKH